MGLSFEGGQETALGGYSRQRKLLKRRLGGGEGSRLPLTKMSPWLPRVPASCRTVTRVRTSLMVEKWPELFLTSDSHAHSPLGGELCPRIPRKQTDVLSALVTCPPLSNKLHPRIWGDIDSSESPGDPDAAVPKREERMDSTIAGRQPSIVHYTESHRCAHPAQVLRRKCCGFGVISEAFCT